MVPFESMPKAQIDPNTITYNATLSACQKGGHWQRALAVFHRMAKARIPGNVTSYDVIIGACEQGCQWYLGMVLLEAVEEVLFREVNDSRLRNG